MSRLRKWMVPILLVTSLGLLAGADIECDLEDGEIEIDLDGRHHYDSYWDEYYYEDYYYSPFGWGWIW